MNYKNCKCRNKLVDKLVEECIENTDGNKILHNETLNAILLNMIPSNDYKKVCGSCTLYIALFAVFFITNICISSVIIYFYWYLKKDNFSPNFNPSTQTTIYQTCKWEISNKLILKIVHITFLMT